MSYVMAYVAAVPTDRKDDYVRLASAMAEVFKEYGATRVVECWGADVPPGKLTSFPLAVKAEAGETVNLSDEIGQKLIGTGSVIAVQQYTPPPPPEPVEVTAQRVVWSVLEEREILSGRRFRVRAEDLDSLLESGAVTLPEPEPAAKPKADPPKTSKRKDSE